mgnify:CR=1 FL=1
MSNNPQPQPIKNDAAAFVLRKTVADLVADEVKAERARLQDEWETWNKFITLGPLQ